MRKLKEHLTRISPWLAACTGPFILTGISVTLPVVMYTAQVPA